MWGFIVIILVHLLSVGYSSLERAISDHGLCLNQFSVHLPAACIQEVVRPMCQSGPCGIVVNKELIGLGLGR